MMRFIYLLLMLFSFSYVKGQDSIFESIKIFYYDTKNGSIKEFLKRGDGSHNKPVIFDVEVKFQDKSTSRGRINIAIEELQVVKNNSSKLFNRFLLSDTSWVLHDVIYSDIYNYKNNSVEVQDVEYKTAYYIDSYIYDKLGFRITVVFFSLNGEIIDLIQREYLYYE